MELWTSLHVSILHPRHHSSWTGLPFLLGDFFMAERFCINDVIVFIILFFVFELLSLVLRNKSSFFFACRWVCMRSFLQVKRICMIRTFHKEYSYWKILMHKYMIMKLLYPIQHSSISHWNFLDAFHLYQDNIEIVH